MERDKKQLSNDNYDMTYAAWLRGEGNGDSLSILYPELPDDYFKNKEDVLTPVRWLPRKHHDIGIYVGTRDLNENTNGDPFDLEDRKPKPVLELGIFGTF